MIRLLSDMLLIWSEISPACKGSPKAVACEPLMKSIYGLMHYSH